MIEKTITIFRNKKPKKPKIWTLGFLGFLKNLKNLGFLKATSTALSLADLLMVVEITDCCKKHLHARMKAMRPNKKPHSQNTKHEKIICSMNVSLASSAFNCPLPVMGGSTTCPVLASCTM